MSPRNKQKRDYKLDRGSRFLKKEDIEGKAVTLTRGTQVPALQVCELTS